MLISFKFKNFRSYKNENVFSMTTKQTKSGGIPFTSLSRESVILGSNNSGKSDLLKAIDTMRKVTLRLNRLHYSGAGVAYYYPHYETSDKDTMFEVTFLKNNIVYRYGFEYNSKVFTKEWFFCNAKGKVVKLFTRNIEGTSYVNKNRFREAYDLYNEKNGKINYPSNELLIARDNENNTLSDKVLSFFKDIIYIDEYELDNNFQESLGIIKKSSHLMVLLNETLQALDNNIKDIYFDKELGEHVVNLVYERGFTMPLRAESSGMQRIVKLLSVFIAYLRKNHLILIDEFSKSLHPLVSAVLLEFFNEESMDDQLIYTTHDVTLVDNMKYPKEKIWLTERVEKSGSRVFSLASLKDVRRGESFKNNYLAGKYGGIPKIKNKK